MSYINANRIILKENEKPNPKHLCSSCKGVLIDPKRCLKCHKAICLGCLNKQATPKCKGCSSESFTNASLALRAELENLSIRISCCNEIISYDDIKIHPKFCINAKRCDTCRSYYYPDEKHMCLRVDTYNSEASKELSNMASLSEYFDARCTSSGRLVINPKRRFRPVYIQKNYNNNNCEAYDDVRVYSQSFYTRCTLCLKNDYTDNCVKCQSRICKECTSHALFKRYPRVLGRKILSGIDKVNVLKVTGKNSWCLFNFLYEKENRTVGSVLLYLILGFPIDLAFIVLLSVLLLIGCTLAGVFYVLFILAFYLIYTPFYFTRLKWCRKGVRCIKCY
jgi:hypothetical protein